MSKRCFILLVSGCLLVCFSGFGQAFYTNAFISGAGPEWSLHRVGAAPTGNLKFLGPLGNNDAVLTLADLPSHTEATVYCDLLILRTWDGNGDSDNGPDIWTLKVDSGPTLLKATFLNSFFINKNSTQSYPDDFGSGLHDGRTGAAENNTLGFNWNGRPLDSVYHLAFTFRHTESTLVLHFEGIGLQALMDESWGLANVAVHLGPVPPVVTFGPQNQYAAFGETATFDVRATGSAPLNYQWLFNDTPIAGETQSTLSLPNVQSGHAGKYTVRVSNAVGSVLSEPVDLSVFNARPTKLWEFAADRGISAPPALGRDGTVYVGSIDRKLYALDSHGSNLWQFAVTDSQPNGAPGIVSSPSVGGKGQIYFAARDNYLYALEPTGTTVWARTVNGGFDASTALGNDERSEPGLSDGIIYAFTLTGGWFESSPALGADGTVYVGAEDHRLYANTADGASLWGFTTSGPIDSSPAIGSDGTIYVGSSDGRLYAIAPNGTSKWSFATGGPIESSPAVGSDGTIFFGSGDKKLYAVNPDGTQKWAFAADVPIGSSPAIGSDGAVYFGPVSGKVFALNPDGSVRWVFETGVGVFSASPALSLDGVLYVAGASKLYALKVESGLAHSSWPMFRHDPRHTGNARLTLAYPATLSSPTFRDGAFAFDVYGQSGATYEIDRSEDLRSWTVFTNVSTLDLHTPLRDPAPEKSGSRFYRVIVP
jgi:outer membrane protein assembly factor BamB